MMKEAVLLDYFNYTLNSKEEGVKVFIGRISNTTKHTYVMYDIIQGSSQGELNTEKTNPLLNYSTKIGTIVAACCGCQASQCLADSLQVVQVGKCCPHCHLRDETGNLESQLPFRQHFYGSLAQTWQMA